MKYTVNINPSKLSKMELRDPHRIAMIFYDFYEVLVLQMSIAVGWLQNLINSKDCIYSHNEEVE